MRITSVRLPRRFTPRNDGGFTFIELLVVITIIGVVFSAGIVSFTAITVRSRDTRRKADLEAMRQSLEICRSLTGSYPDLADVYPSIRCGPTGAVMMIQTPLDPKPCGSPAVSSYLYSRTTLTEYVLTAPCMEVDTTYQVTNP